MASVVKPLYSDKLKASINSINIGSTPTCYANQQIGKMTTFGIAVSDARKALGLSQKELAAQIKKEDGEPISPQYLNDIERDRRNAPSQHLILEFARVLKLKTDYLFALAQAWPKDIVEKMSRSSPEDVQEAFSAFRKTLKGKQ